MRHIVTDVACSVRGCIIFQIVFQRFCSSFCLFLQSFLHLRRRAHSLSLVSDYFKSNIWQCYKQERGFLMHFARMANTLLEDEESARDNYVLACNFAKYSPI